MYDIQQMSDVTVMILTGGKGTRLRSAVSDRPKALAPVLGTPFIFYLLEQLDKASVRKVVLLTGHRADQVVDAVGESYRQIAIRYSTEERPLGTAGALRAALGHVDSDDILLMNGDSYCSLDLPAMLDFHRRNAADMTLASTWSNETNRFGKVAWTDDYRIAGFYEKQTGSEPGWINAGLYFLTRRLVEEIPVDRFVSLEREMIPRWLATYRLYAYQSSGTLYDIGTPEAYQNAGSFMSGQLS